MLTRLRQLTLHPGLVPKSYMDELTKEPSGHDHAQPLVTATERIRLQNVLFKIVEDNEECPVCFDVLSNPRITPCAHAFCLECITNVILRNPECPMVSCALLLLSLA